MSTHRPDGTEGARKEEEEEEEEHQDDLLRSLAEELVWKGGDENDEEGDDYDGQEEEYEDGELEGLDLDGLGISMMVSSFLSALGRGAGGGEAAYRVCPSGPPGDKWSLA